MEKLIQANSRQQRIIKNALIQSSCASNTNQLNMQFQINRMGIMTDCDFYVPDATGDTTGLAFRIAYDASCMSYFSSDKEICASVGTMLCSVVPGFRNSIEAALIGTGIRPRIVSVPSQAHQNNKVDSNFPQLDWSSILVVFGYCVLILFKIDNSQLFGFDPNSTNANRIVELRAKVGCSPSNSLAIPLSDDTENEIRTMLGTHALRTSVIMFLMNNFDHPDSQICNLCQYLSGVLSWSGDMRVFTVMNKWLIKTNSPVLSDYRVTTEVDNFEETVKAIASHFFPQYFNHLCLVSQLFYLDISRFRTLFAVALELEKGGNGTDVNYFSEVIPRAERRTVQELVILHRTAMAQNQVTTVRRRMPTIPGLLF